MGRPDGAHTHGGGGDWGGAVVAVAAAVLVLAVAGPVAAVVAGLVEVVLFAALAALGLAVIGGGVLLVVYLRRSPAQLPPVRVQATVQRPRTVAAQREVHVHFHGLSVEDARTVLDPSYVITAGGERLVPVEQARGRSWNRG